MGDRPTAEDFTAGSAEERDRFALFQLALESADAMTWMWDLATDRLTWAGKTGHFMSGVSAETTVLTGMEFLSKVHPDDRELAILRTSDLFVHPGEFVQEYRAIRADGEVRWYVSRGSAVVGDGGKVIRIQGVVQDITDRRLTAEALRGSQERFRSVLTGAPLAIVAFDAAGVVTLAQGSALDAMRVDGDALVGNPVHEFLEDYPEALTAVERALAGEIVDARLELSGVTFDMSYRPLRSPDDEVIGAVIVATDVTEKVRAEQQLARLALHDPLTDLANRVLFNNRLELHLSRSARRHGHTVVLFLDLDRFKQINDTHGHHVGDDLLRGVADRLRHSVRPEDTIARFGGDEFLILGEVAGPVEVEIIARRILAAVSEPMQIGPLVLQVGVSIGAAIAGPTSECNVTEVAALLIRQADTAMYRAKQDGRGRFVVVSDHGQHPART